jgi:hypothetical protein
MHSRFHTAFPTLAENLQAALAAAGGRGFSRDVKRRTGSDSA